MRGKHSRSYEASSFTAVLVENGHGTATSGELNDRTPSDFVLLVVGVSFQELLACDATGLLISV